MHKSPMPGGRRSEAETLLEHPAKMRMVFKPTSPSDLGYRIASAGEQLMGMGQPPLEQPLSRGHLEARVEVALECCQTPSAQLCQLR